MLVPRLHIHLFDKAISSFHFFGAIGFIAGTSLGIVLCNLLNLQTSIALLMSLTGAVTFFLLAISAKIITGEEVIVYYHHEIAILITCAIVLNILHAPVLNYLDLTIVGIATFLAFGRIGCFNVGCCHGKPVKKGVIYQHEHVASGFTFYYEGVPLLPVQLIESAFVFIIITISVFLLLHHYAAGTVLIIYTVIYGLFRFVIEFFRGDPERPYWKGLSEAQWTTLLLIAISIICSFANLIPFYKWHIVISFLLFLTGCLILIRNNAVAKIVRPRHIREIAMALKESTDHGISKKHQSESNAFVNVYHTNLGLNLSRGSLESEEGLISHYTISYTKKKLTLSIIKRIAEIIQQLKKHENSCRIFEKNGQVFHLVFTDRLPLDTSDINKHVPV